MDTKTEDIVYVPEERESTVIRLTRRGFTKESIILFQDEFGTKTTMIAMRRKQPWREPIVGEMLICGACGCDVEPLSEEWLQYYNKCSDETKVGLFDSIWGNFLSHCGCVNEVEPLSTQYLRI